MDRQEGPQQPRPCLSKPHQPPSSGRWLEGGTQACRLSAVCFHNYQPSLAQTLSSLRTGPVCLSGTAFPQAQHWAWHPVGWVSGWLIRARLICPIYRASHGQEGVKRSLSAWTCKVRERRGPTQALIITHPIMTRCYNRHTKCTNLILYLGFLQ